MVAALARPNDPTPHPDPLPARGERELAPIASTPRDDFSLLASAFDRAVYGLVSTPLADAREAVLIARRIASRGEAP
jgi:hypothetical protein